MDRRFRAGCLVLVALSALGGCGCRTEPGLDSGAPAGDGGDGGDLEDGGAYDSGQPRPQFQSCDGVMVALPARPPDCGCDPRQDCHLGSCTWQCAPCSSLSPCPPGWICDLVSVPYCEGVCRTHSDDCQVVPNGSVTLDLVWRLCGGNKGGCTFRHDVTSDAGVTTVSCSIVAEWLDSGVQIGTAQGDAGLWTGLFVAGCVSSVRLASRSCLSNQAEVVVKFSEDAGFEYGTGTAFRPPAVFESAAAKIFGLCAAQFRSWDGGTYPYTY